MLVKWKQLEPVEFSLYRHLIEMQLLLAKHFCDGKNFIFSGKLFSGLSSFTKTVFTVNFPSTVFDLLGNSHKFVADCDKLNPILFRLFWRWSRVVIVSSSSLCFSVISSKRCPNNTYNCRESIYWFQFN